MLEVRLIGKFDIQCDGKPVTISSRVAQSLFAYLILNAGTSYRREKLAGMFWPTRQKRKHVPIFGMNSGGFAKHLLLMNS